VKAGGGRGRRGERAELGAPEIRDVRPEGTGIGALKVPGEGAGGVVFITQRGAYTVFIRVSLFIPEIHHICERDFSARASAWDSPSALL
jgi:hypothetical protein